MSKLIDANLVLRFFLNDTPYQAEAVEKLFKLTKTYLILTDLTVAEVVWVLQSVYKLGKEEISEKIKTFISFEKIHADKPLLVQALNNYQSYNVSFVDAYLTALCEVKKFKAIYSYDRGLDKIKGIKRIEP